MPAQPDPRDPTLGRFLSADPFVQDAPNSRALNPYSHVLGIEAALGSAMIAGAASGAISSGGDLHSICVSAMTAAAFYDVGQVVKAEQWVAEGADGIWRLTPTANLAKHMATHDMVGGFSAVASEGKFHQGFLAAGISKFAGPVIKSGNLSVVGSAVAHSVVGGTASATSGGKFANGAQTAAFGHLFNDVMHISFTANWSETGARVISWLTGRTMEASGGALGLAISYPGASGGEYDIGFILGAELVGGISEGYGTPIYGLEGALGTGSVKDLAGIGMRFSFNDGIGGMTVNTPVSSIAGPGSTVA